MELTHTYPLGIHILLFKMLRVPSPIINGALHIYQEDVYRIVSFLEGSLRNNSAPYIYIVAFLQAFMMVWNVDSRQIDVEEENVDLGPG